MKLYSKRNAVGYYDGRHIKILPLPKGSRTAADVPENNSEFGPYLKFAANKNGQFSIEANDKEVRLDISFDDMKYY